MTKDEAAAGESRPRDHEEQVDAKRLDATRTGTSIIASTTYSSNYDRFERGQKCITLYLIGYRVVLAVQAIVDL